MILNLTVKISRPAAHKLLHVRLCSSAKDWIVERAKPSDSNNILKFLDENFMKNEPLAKALICGEHPEITRKIYKDCIDEGLSVVARKTRGDREIIGINLNGCSNRTSHLKFEETIKTIPHDGYRKFLETVAIMEAEANLLEKLKQSELFAIKFLSVHKSYWGQNVSVDLLQNSIKVALAENFQFGKVNCVNENCKKFAEMFKLKLAWSAPYAQLLCRGDICPRAFPEAPHHNAYVYYSEMKKFAK